MPTAHPLPVRSSGTALTVTTAGILSKAVSQHDCHWREAQGRNLDLKQAEAVTLNKSVGQV